jgi:hypothetical protein
MLDPRVIEAASKIPNSIGSQSVGDQLGYRLDPNLRVYGLSGQDALGVAVARQGADLEWSYFLHILEQNRRLLGSGFKMQNMFRMVDVAVEGVVQPGLLVQTPRMDGFISAERLSTPRSDPRTSRKQRRVMANDVRAFRGIAESTGRAPVVVGAEMDEFGSLTLFGARSRVEQSSTQYRAAAQQLEGFQSSLKEWTMWGDVFNLLRSK